MKLRFISSPFIVVVYSKFGIHHVAPASGTLLLVSNRPWNKALADRLGRQLNFSIETISQPAELTSQKVAAINPVDFCPSWSHLIPKSIWSEWPTVIFHMTSLSGVVVAPSELNTKGI